MNEPQDKARYQEYLRSEKWQAIRQRVLIRDRHLCQACLKNRAFEVHHLHYKNIYNEFMFDLVSVCTECHERLHGFQPKAPHSRLNRGARPHG